MSSPRLMWFVVAEGAALDQLTGRTTAFNMFDSVAVSQFPSRLMRLTCIAGYELTSPDSAPLLERVCFEDPDAQLGPRAESVSEVRFPIGGLVNTHRSIHVLWNLDLRVRGTYRVKLQTRANAAADWETRADLPVNVSVMAHPVLNQKLD